MDEDRHPGPDLITWAALGLLGLSLALLAGSFVYATMQTPGLGAVVAGGVLWLFAAGPHVLFAYAIWRGGRDTEIATIILTNAVFGIVISLVLTASMIFDGSRSTLGPFICTACLLWLGGWPLGVRAVVLARRQPPISPPDDDD